MLPGEMGWTRGSAATRLGRAGRSLACVVVAGVMLASLTPCENTLLGSDHGGEAHHMQPVDPGEDAQLPVMLAVRTCCQKGAPAAGSVFKLDMAIPSEESSASARAALHPESAVAPRLPSEKLAGIDHIPIAV